MELCNELLVELLAKQGPSIVFQKLKVEPEELIEAKSYQTLKKIKAIIEDDSLEDNECFFKIEKVVCLLEEIGSDGGNRHDFG